MNSSTQPFSLANYYLGFLKNLNTASKLEIISKLTESLSQSKEVQDISLDALFGAYQSDETAEEIIESIRASRVFTRNIEPF